MIFRKQNYYGGVKTQLIKTIHLQ